MDSYRGANVVDNVIDFAAYRAAHPRQGQPALPFAGLPARPLTMRNTAHRARMLRHLRELTAERRLNVATS